MHFIIILQEKLARNHSKKIFNKFIMKPMDIHIFRCTVKKKFQVKNISKFKGFSRQIPSTLISFCLSAQPTPHHSQKKNVRNLTMGIAYHSFFSRKPPSSWNRWLRKWKTLRTRDYLLRIIHPINQWINHIFLGIFPFFSVKIQLKINNKIGC